MPTPATTSPLTLEDDGIERPSKRLRTAALDSPSQVREVGFMRRTDQDNHVSFLGSASGIHFIRSVYAAIGDKGPGNPGSLQTPEADLVTGDDDRLGSETTDTVTSSIWQPHEVTEDPAQSSFTFDDLVSWSRSYFDNWFPAYPFLHAPTILEFFERFAAVRGQAQGGEKYVFECAILRTIMSIALADRRQSGTVGPRPIPAILVFSSFKSAMESVQVALSVRTSILSLQAVLCVQLFFLSMLRHNAASRFGGLITRMIYHLGLHRCPARYTAFSNQEIMIRKRIFWSVYCMDRYVNQSLGIPLTLRDDDLDVCFLDCEVHETSSTTSDLDERLVLLDLLSKHAEVKGLIMELLHKSISHRQSSHDQSLMIQSKLTKWSNQVEAYLDVDNDEQSLFSNFHEMMLTVLKQECVIALNRPLLTPSQKSSDHNAALHTCIGAARSIITSLSSFLERSRRSNSEIRVPLLWPSFTWAIWMSTFILVFATIEDEIPRRVALRLTDKSLEILKHLSLRGSVWPKACEAAICELRTRLLEPQSSQRNLAGSSTDQRRSHQETSSTNSQPSRQPLRRMSPDVDSTLQIRGAEHSGQQYQGSSTRITPGRNPSPGWTHFGNTTTTATVAPYSNLMMNQLNTADTMRNPLNVQQAPDWLENATSAAEDHIDLFQGFEIPFWMGDDQYNSLFTGS